MNEDKSVHDAELHAYLDQQLDETRRKQIENNLLSDDMAREKLEGYLKINQALHNIYDPVLEEAVPKRLLPKTTRHNSYWAVAASMTLFLFGALFGWQSQVYLAGINAVSSETNANLVQPAAFAHAVYSVEVAHPVEVSAEQHQHLNKWLSKRLNTTLNAPDLTTSGYKLVGGRLLPSTENRMAAQFMYEDNTGGRITLYVRRGNWGADTQAINYSEQKGLSMFYWIDNDMGYALTGNTNKHMQQALAREVYKQMSINTVKI